MDVCTVHIAPIEKCVIEEREEYHINIQIKERNNFILRFSVCVYHGFFFLS